MKLLISPAKQMKRNTDFMEISGLPAMLDKTEEILQVMKGFSLRELKRIFKANDKITAENYERYQQMDLRKGLTPAVLSYSGLAFTNMAPQVFTDIQWEYARKNLKIASGFYGILNATDGVVPYRLEMQVNVSVAGHKNLYEFWGDSIYKSLAREAREDAGSGKEAVILNLASKEYSQAVEPFLEEDISFVTCIFAEWSDGRLITKGTKAKMARGQMVAYLAQEQAESLEQVRQFHELGYVWQEELSNEKEFVFIQDKF